MGAERCPQCGAELPAGARFCAQCGVAIESLLEVPAGRPAARDERRIITALFADLAGSTQLGESLDPEDFRDLTAGALARMGAAIEELGGTVRGTAGDGILGLFGAPTAHEDDAERAVIAGLKLVDSMREYGHEAAQRWKVPGLGVRVGIETGLAVLGEVRAGSQSQYDASGDCLNTAARLEAAADPFGVLVGPVTHRSAVGLFDWGDPRPLALKGKSEPVVGRHALSVRTGRPQHGSASIARLIGRDLEVGLVRSILAEVTAGTSRTVFITGAAGIGKTRFMSEVRSFFAGAASDGAQGPVWLEGGCPSYGGDEPYLPFRQVLRAAMEHGANDLPDVLRMVLGLQLDRDDASRLAALSAESLQQTVIEAVANLVAGLSGQGPVGIALDDLHWADAASLRLAEGLAAQLPVDAPVLLVLGMRSETDRAAWSLRERMLERDSERSTELCLSALDRDAEQGLIADLVGEGTLPHELESRLLRRAEGNPFYLGELLRSLRDAGAIVQEADGRWRFDRDVAVELPDTVERVVLARIDRLPPGDRDLLNAAAVLGREFDLPLMGRVAGEVLSPTSLSNLTRLGLFEEAGSGFQFSHPLIQETAYLSLLRRTRTELHRRAAAALEERAATGSAVEHHSALARHHGAAGCAAEAVKYHRLAALASLRVAAADEALNQLDLALAAAGSLDEESERRQMPELHLLRGRARGRLGDYAGGIADLRQALRSVRVVADDHTQMQALDELGWLLRAHSYEEAVSHHEQALALAERLGDARTQVMALSRMAMIELNRLRLDLGLDLAERSLLIARDTGRDELLGAALDCLKLAAMQLGHLDLLDRTVNEIAAVHERTGDLYLLQWAYIESATSSVARGDLSEARDRIAMAAEINSRFASDRMSKAMVLEARSWIDRADNDPDVAVATVREAVDLLGETTNPEWSAWLHASLGSHLIAQGNAREATAVLEAALEHSQAIKSPNRTFRAASHLAWAHQLNGNDDGSRLALKQAQDIVATITAPAGELFLDGYRSYIAVARTCLALGDSRGAQQVLAPLLDAARRNGWRNAEREAADLLVSETGAPAPPDQGR